MTDRPPTDDFLHQAPQQQPPQPTRRRSQHAGPTGRVGRVDASPGARPRRSRSAVLVGAGMVVAGLLVGGWAWSDESARSDAATPATSSAANSPSATTAALSARRVPKFLVAPQADRRLNNAIAPKLAALSDTSCFEVRDGERVIVSHGTDQALAVASNQKLLTAWVALEVLGADHTFTTRFATTAPIDGGVINGDLWIIGGGDPLLESDTYRSTFKWGKGAHTSIEAIADELAALGITAITGSVVGDDSFFDAERTVSTWPSRMLAQGQVGPLSALSVNDARTYSPIPGAGGGAQPASDPAAWAADAFTQLLSARGIAVGGAPASGQAPETTNTVLEIASRPVWQLLAQMLTFSDNNTAELLVKAIGREVSGEGSTAAGLVAMVDRLGGLGTDMSQISLLDGSGLDDGSRVTCDLILATLNGDDSDPDPSQGVLAAGLPTANGEVGTLRDRFHNSPGAGRVFAKTGTLRSVTALSGWAQAREERISFATVINTVGREVTGADTNAEDALAAALIDYPDSIDPALVGPSVPRP